MPNRKKSKKKEKEEEEELEALRKEVEEERREKAEVEWVANELGKCVDEMEKNVHQLESGNYDFDDSEIKQRYDNQRQLNIQLLEQKHWLEHELEEIKLKIQNDKLSFLPDPFMMDWDNLSETELKRLVLQLEKTKADVILDLRDAQLHLDHEGREFFHFDHFCQVYRTEILNLNRTLDSLMRHGALPTGYTISSFNSILSSNNSSYASTGAQTPNAPVSPKKIQHSPRKSAPLSPRRMPPVVRQRSSPSGGRSSETMSAGAATARQVSPKKKTKNSESCDISRATQVPKTEWSNDGSKNGTCQKDSRGQESAKT